MISMFPLAVLNSSSAALYLLVYLSFPQPHISRCGERTKSHLHFCNCGKFSKLGSLLICWWKEVQREISSLYYSFICFYRINKWKKHFRLVFINTPNSMYLRLFPFVLKFKNLIRYLDQGSVVVFSVPEALSFQEVLIYLIELHKSSNERTYYKPQSLFWNCY